MSNLSDIIEDLGEDLLEDLSANILAELETIEQHIMNIGTGGDLAAGSAGILDCVENIKTNCRRAFIDPLVAYVQVVGDLVESLCHNERALSDILLELLLLMFDQIRAAVEDVHLRHNLDIQLLDEFRQSIKGLVTAPKNALEARAREMISAFAYRVHPDMVFRASEIIVDAQPLPPEPAHRQELGIFEGIALALDQKSPFTEHRTETMRSLAVAINQCLSNHGTDEEQLLAALYMHDIGMAFIPDDVLEKQGKLDADEIMLLEQHPLHGFQLLGMMPDWRLAAEMVYQHHEHYDGGGYPRGIAADAICKGAKILAIVDAYYALTTARAHRRFKKSTLRALMEINKCNGTQFDPAVVEALNQVLRESTGSI